MNPVFSVELSEVVANGIAQFKAVSFPPGFGFDPFETQDVVDYLVSPYHYNLSLKKIRGAGVLYGTVHAEIRRNFFNHLPQTDRLSVIHSKLDYFKINPHIQHFFGTLDPVDVIDAHDIGMGHSVYHLTTSYGDLVVKQEDFPNQQFYMKLQRRLEYPWFRSHHYVGERPWELTDYLGALNLNQQLVTHRDDIGDDLIIQLGGHAAIGDVLGREDRHFENYMVRDGVILPVDTSILFGEGNEVWGERYIAGGLYEICILSQLMDQPERLFDCFELFHRSYQHRFLELKRQRHLLIEVISEFFEEKTTDSYRCRYVQDRLNDLGYIRVQFERYRKGLVEMMYRKVYRDALSRYMVEHPDRLDQSPLLKMVYLADQNRVSSLFLLEMRRPEVMAEFERYHLLKDSDYEDIDRYCGLINRLSWPT